MFDTVGRLTVVNGTCTQTDPERKSTVAARANESPAHTAGRRRAAPARARAAPAGRGRRCAEGHDARTDLAPRLNKLRITNYDTLQVHVVIPLATCLRNG